MTPAAPETSDTNDTGPPEVVADDLITPGPAAPVADSAPPTGGAAQSGQPGGRESAAEEQLGEDRRDRRRSGPWIALPVLVVVAGLVWIAATAGKPDAYDARSPLLGKPVPAVTGETVQGGRFDLGAMRGRWVVVNYFATWCRECRVEHPELERFFQAHEAAGDATVVSVVFNDTPRAVRAFLAGNGGSWPMVIDPGGQIAVNFGVGKVPESYLVSPNGYVVAKIVGGVQTAGLEALLQRAETGARSKAVVERPGAELVTALCDAAGKAGGDPAAARKVFFDRAHQPIHELAAAHFAGPDRTAAAHLLETTQRVEADLGDRGVADRLAEDLTAVADAVRALPAPLGQPAPSSCPGGTR